MNIENIKNNIWKVGLATLSVFCLLLIAVFVLQIKNIFGEGNHFSKDSSVAKDTITVNGKGDVTVIPDIATFNFSVTETAKNVGDAQNAATTKINAAMKALDDAGIDTKKDVKTLSYNINPNYEYQTAVCTAGYCPPSKSVLTGYNVSQTIQVKVRDISKAGALFSTIGSLNVQNVDSLSFSVDNIDTVNDNAKIAAITDAKVHAEKIAEALGVHLGKVTGFSDSTSGGVPYPVMYENASVMGSAKMASAPQVPAGEQKVTSNVSVTYEIK
jgi:uncharacterized protein YggE